MALNTMYPAKANSPQTTLSADVTAAATSIAVTDASKLPDGPNLCTIGSDANAEVISYTAKSGNTLTGCVRGVSGTTAKGWSTGAAVSRQFTSYDHDTFISNITDLGSGKQDTLTFDESPTSGSSNPVTSGGIYTALAAKAALASPTFTGTPKAPTASSGTNTTQIATTAFVATAAAGKADASHSHSAADITSGVLATARGGTGNGNGTIAKLTTARSLYVNLASAYNSSSPVTFDGAANKVLPVTGALPIANGGTGATTAANAWTALGGGAIGKKASLSASDIPNLPASKITSGQLATNYGGTGGTFSSVQWVNSADVQSNSALWCYKMGKLVVISGFIKLTSMLGDAYIDLSNPLASGYRPSTPMYTLIGGQDGWTVSSISTGGVIRIYRGPNDYINNTWNLYFNVTFFTS